MRNPEEIFTRSGLEDFRFYLKSIDKALFFIINHADDLQLTDDEDDTIQNIQQFVDTWINK